MSTQSLIQLLLYLLIGGLVVWLVFWIVGMLNLEPQVQRIITIVIAIIVILWLLSVFFPNIMGSTALPAAMALLAT